MAMNEADNRAVLQSDDQIAWLPLITPVLEGIWTQSTANPPTVQPVDLSSWLALLQLATTAPPDQLIPAISKLLQFPKSSRDIQIGWATLTQLFTFTFQAVQAEANRLDITAWQQLLDLQNRVMQAATQVLVAGQKRPTTDVLARRALYLQTINELHEKLIDLNDWNKLLDEVVSLLQKNLNYEYISLFLLNRAKQTLTLQNARWQNRRPDTVDLNSLRVGGREITARAAATKQIVLVNDLTQEPDFLPYPALPHVKAQLSVPLLADDHLLGVLDIASDQTGVFSKDDCQILQALASHIAIAIENARLQNTLERHTRAQKLFYDSNVALGTSLDTETVLKLATQKMVEAVEAGACVICRIDEKNQTTTALAEYVAPLADHPYRTWRDLKVPLLLSKDPVSQQILKTGRPVIGRANPRKLTNWQQPGAEKSSKPGWGTVLALPLGSKKQITGLIEIYDRSPQRSFSPDDIELCQILVTQIILALERSQLFEQTRHQLEQVSTLYMMVQKIAGKLDLQEVMDTIVVALRQIMGCRGCCIFLLDQTGQQLEIRAADGLKPEWKQAAKLRVGEGAAGRAVAQGQTIYIPDTRQEPDFIFFDQSVRSLMVTPLSINGEIIGAINADDSQPHAFGPAQEQLLTIAAVQIGIAISNARLFTKISTDQQQTQAIIQHMADGLLVVDSKGIITTCNPALTVILRMPRDEIIGQSVTSPDLHPILAKIMASTSYRARTGVLAREVMVETPTPKTLQVFSTTMVSDTKSASGEVYVVHDVTRERQLERLKTDFMSTISHELRTPLFSIQGFAQILLEDGADLDQATRVEFLNTIHTQAVHLGEMVNNLLDLSKFDEGRLEFERNQVVMLDLLDQVNRKLQGFAHQQKIRLTADLPASLPLITGDRDRIEQVVTNLLGNAIKFTKESGQVHLTASASEAEILVEIKDNGVGISPDELEHIFSRYYQGHERGKETIRGSGLGLHIAKKIVEGHGGRIWAESQTGQGSIFRFTLPVAGSINHLNR